MHDSLEQNGTFLMKIGAACVAFGILPAGVTKVNSDLTHCGFKERFAFKTRYT